MSDFREYKEVTFAGINWRSRSQFLFVIALAVIAFILLLLSIVFITLYALEKAKSPTVPAEQERGKEMKYCGTKSCFDATLGKQQADRLSRSTRNYICKADILIVMAPYYATVVTKRRNDLQPSKTT